MAGIGGLNQQAKVEREPGTIERVSEIAKHLSQLQERLRQVNSALHGPRPEATETKPPAPNNLVSWINVVEEQIDGCSGEVNEIFKSLGL